MGLEAIGQMITQGAKAAVEGVKSMGKQMNKTITDMSTEERMSMMGTFKDMMQGTDSGFYKHMDASKLPRQKICGGQCGPLKKGK